MYMQGILGTDKGSEIIACCPSYKDGRLLDVYFGTRHLTSIGKDDGEAKKVLVAFLANAGVKRVELARAFSINPCLVTRYSKKFSKEGITSLLADERGRPEKITEKISGFVKEEYIRLKGKRVKSIRPLISAKVRQKFGLDISKELIRQITIPVRQKVLLPKKPDKNIRPEKEAINGGRLASRLKAGFYSRYAAALVLNVFISRLIGGVLKGCRDLKKAVNLETFVIMIIHMVSFSVINLERVKRIVACQFGLLMGLDRSPDLKTARRKLAAAARTLNIENISAALASNYLANLSLGTDIFYIDDHLDTYSGKAKVLSGFSHIYDRMMEGTLHTFVHDRWGNPICFTLRDNFASFSHYIPIMVEKIKALNAKCQKPTFVFDRGGYDSKLFCSFDRLDSFYIVWSKDDRTDYEKEDLKFKPHTVSFKANTIDKPRKVTFGIAEVPSEKEGQRRIVIRRKAQRRIASYRDYMYSSLVTNDPARPADDVVEAIIYRWRQECDFKIEVEEFGIDQITSYSMEDYRADIFKDSSLAPELTSERTMANPQLNPLNRKKKSIKNEIAKIDESLGRWAFTTTAKKDRTIAQVAELKRNQSSLKRRGELILKLEKTEDKIALLPKRINRLDYLVSKKFKVFDFRKKLIADTLKVCSRNVRKMALEVLDHHYHNYRDQLDYLKRIITAGAQVRLNEKGTVIVCITPFNTKKENKILAGFLKEINSMGPQMFGSNPYPIKFKVGKA